MPTTKTTNRMEEQAIELSLFKMKMKRVQSKIMSSFQKMKLNSTQKELNITNKNREKKNLNLKKEQSCLNFQSEIKVTIS